MPWPNVLPLVQEHESRRRLYSPPSVARGEEEVPRGLRSLVSAFLLRVHLSLLIQFNIHRCGWIESGDHMQSVIELRKTKRYRLSAPALFLWASHEGKPKSGQGVTRDINASGVYVLTDA